MKLVTILTVTLLAANLAGAQAPAAGALQEAARLDSRGDTREARALIQGVIDTATAPLAKALAQRTMAISFAFDGDCANTAKYERLVMTYWKTREQAEPQNAWYQQGEMANEAARVCIDAGQLDTAETYYRMGTELGLGEPEPITHPRSLWAFRLAHARARLAARRGDPGEAHRQVAEARRILDSDTKMAAAQERFFPYLTGYVALFTGDLDTAQAELTKALAIQGNQNDPFMHVLLAMAYEKAGQSAKARSMYEQAYGLATAHNPPSAFVRPLARRKLAVSGS